MREFALLMVIVFKLLWAVLVFSGIAFVFLVRILLWSIVGIIWVVKFCIEWRKEYLVRKAEMI